MGRIVKSSVSGHTFFVEKVTMSDLPKKSHDDARKYNTFYAVKNFDKNGKVFFYLMKGYLNVSNEVVVVYGNGQISWGLGKNLKEAITIGQTDGWMYTK